VTSYSPITNLPLLLAIGSLVNVLFTSCLKLSPQSTAFSMIKGYSRGPICLAGSGGPGRGPNEGGFGGPPCLAFCSTASFCCFFFYL